MKSVLDFAAAKAAGRKISMVTCYDSSFARVLEATAVDCILVGDSAAMVVHGHSDTLAATVEMMALHTAAVRRGAPTRFLIGDMPFLSFRKGVPAALDAVAALMRAGAQAVKLEGVAGPRRRDRGHRRLRHAGHGPSRPHAAVGQCARGLSACRAAARTTPCASSRTRSASRRSAASRSCSSACPRRSARASRRPSTIPTIGVGAGIHCDGQVLVLQDLLGLTGGHRPKFVRTYLDGNQAVRDAIDRFDRDVKQGAFPTRRRELRRMKVVEGVEELIEHRRSRGAGATGLRADARRAARGAPLAAAAREGGERARLGQHLRESRAVQRPGRPRALSAHDWNRTSRCCATPAANSCSCRAPRRSTATATAIASARTNSRCSSRAPRARAISTAC